MSFARPSSPSGFHPDTVRIVAMSATIALNTAALVAVMRPMVAQIVTATPVIQAIHLVDHPVEPKPIPPPPIDLKPVPVAHHVPTAAARPQPVAHPAAVPTDEGSAPMTVPMATDTPTAAPAVEAAPVEAKLAYVAAPAPAYPRAAMQRHLQGTVTLRVLVDETGKPVQVDIERSSGHTLLDTAARDQVLAAWRFQPAQAGGHAVRAWARIPVTFDLRTI